MENNLGTFATNMLDTIKKTKVKKDKLSEEISVEKSKINPTSESIKQDYNNKIKKLKNEQKVKLNNLTKKLDLYLTQDKELQEEFEKIIGKVTIAYRTNEITKEEHDYLMDYI